MERLTRRNILGAAGAFASGSTLAATALAAPSAMAPASDPILALIAEERRLRDLGCSLQDKATLIARELPDDIRRGPRVVFRSRYGDIVPKPSDRFKATPYHFRTEQDLLEWLDNMSRAWRPHYFTEARCAELLAEYRADKTARVDPVLEASGYTACNSEGDALIARAGVLYDQIEDVEPITLGGVIAMIELADYESDPVLVRAVEGLRALATGGAA